MSLISCNECRKEISSLATACPGCGAPVGAALKKLDNHIGAVRKKGIFKFLCFLIFLAFALSINGLLTKKPQSSQAVHVAYDQPDATGTVSRPIPPTPAPAIPVSAKELMAAYQANEVSADVKYKGRRISIKGVVASINKDFSDDIWVGIDGGNQFFPIHASGFSADQVVNLQKGQVIFLTCTGAGMIMISPNLKDCE